MTSPWHRNLLWIALGLSLWFAVTFVIAWLARDLAFEVAGWPFSFWVAAQGAPLVYLLIVGAYGFAMNRQSVGPVDTGGQAHLATGSDLGRPKSVHAHAER